jgi:hypothetical protein
MNFRYGLNPIGFIIVAGVNASSDPQQTSSSHSSLETISVDRSNGVVTITFNRPKRKNAVNGKMWIELLETLTEIQHNSADRVVVLTGAGGEFCSGADLVAMGDSGGRTHSHSYYSMREVTGVISRRSPKFAEWLSESDAIWHSVATSWQHRTLRVSRRSSPSEVCRSTVADHGSFRAASVCTEQKN